jgi:hypothetical protein
LADTPDLDMLERLREVLGDERVTEAELRSLTERADALVRVASGQVEGAELRLAELTDDPASSLSDVAGELHRAEVARRRLAEARSLQAGLEQRAHELRSGWLLGQAP